MLLRWSPSLFHGFAQFYSLHGCTVVFQKHRHHHQNPLLRIQSFPSDFRIQDKVTGPTGPSMSNSALAKFSPRLFSSFLSASSLSRFIICLLHGMTCSALKDSMFPTSKFLPTHYSPPPLPCAHLVGLEMLDQKLLIQIPREDRQIT